MVRRRSARWLYTAILALAAMAASGEPFVLVNDGKPASQIVTGTQPPETVAFAARELQEFVRKMSGAELPIVDKAVRGMPSILLGPAARARVPQTALAEIRRDGYLIRHDGPVLYIVGIDDTGPHTDIEALLTRGITHDVGAWTFHRGTLYGVYRLLEELGVRWYMPGEFGERVPERRTLHFAGELRENPHFVTRTVSYWSMWTGSNFRSDAQKPTIPRGEREAIGFTARENRLWELRMRGESFRIPLNHNPKRTQWFERFGADHPEYFALLPEGTRNLESRIHLCYTHPQVLRERVADIRAFAAGREAGARGITSVHPYNRNWSPAIALDGYYSVLPNDGFRACTCPPCLAMVPEDVVLVRQQYSKLVWDFVSQCAKAVPDVKIACLAYGSYAIPYPGMPQLPTNVVVGFCASPFTRPSALYYKDAFERYEELMSEWAGLAQQPLAFWQHYLGANGSETTLGLPEHTPQMNARSIRLMAQHGNHVFCEMPADAILFELYNRYLLLKLFYTPDLDEREVWNDFLTGFYGPAAGPILGEVYADIGRRNVERVQQRAGRFESWTEFYPAEILRSYHQKVAAARQKAVGTPYEKAVAAFDTYYLGHMDFGLAQFAAFMGEALQTPNPQLVSRFAKQPPTIDGRLEEAAWTGATPAGLFDNQTGQPATLPAEVRTTYDDTFIYFGITAHDPDAADLRRVTGVPGTVDGVEIFLDTLHNKESYYQAIFDLAGGLTELHYPDRIEPARLDWRSHAEWAMQVHPDRYVVEIALPRAALEGAEGDLAGKTWGILVGRTVSARQKEEGRFSSTSAILRKGFHQPALFNHLVFEK